MEKKLHVLIAEPRDTFREGLYSLFAKEASVAQIAEATTCENLQTQLKRHRFDLVVIHQSLITDISLLPWGHFVILTTKPDIKMYWAARIHGARGYLFDTASSSLLREVLYLPVGAFLTDPETSVWLEGYASQHLFLSLNYGLLSSREQEVFRLRWAGYSRRAIAKRLKCSEATIKSHITHVYEKLGSNRFQIEILSFLNKQDPEEG